MFLALAEVELVVEILLRGDERGLGKALVVAGDFDLLAVLVDFLEVVVERREFLELLVEFALHLGGDFVGALGYDADGLVDVAGVLGELDHVAGHGVERGVGFLVVNHLFSGVEYMIPFVLSVCGGRGGEVSR